MDRKDVLKLGVTLGLGALLLEKGPEVLNFGSRVGVIGVRHIVNNTLSNASEALRLVRGGISSGESAEFIRRCTDVTVNTAAVSVGLRLIKKVTDPVIDIVIR